MSGIALFGIPILLIMLFYGFIYPRLSHKEPEPIIFTDEYIDSIMKNEKEKLKVNYQKQIEKQCIDNFMKKYNLNFGGKTRLYYIKTFDENNSVRYKIGITSNNANRRYGTFSHNGEEWFRKYDYDILFDRNIKYAKNAEQAILSIHSKFITNEELLGTSGTEIFNKDVLELDFKDKINKITEEDYLDDTFYNKFTKMKEEHKRLREEYNII